MEQPCRVLLSDGLQLRCNLWLHHSIIVEDKSGKPVVRHVYPRRIECKAGRAFDSTWGKVAHDWLSTLILDNNRVVKPQIAPELQPVAQEHTTWLFHQSAELDKLRKKFK